MEFSTKGGGGSATGRFSTKKEKKEKKCKDDQNSPIHQENSKLNFLIIGGVRSNFRADSPILFLFNLILFLWSYLLKYGR